MLRIALILMAIALVTTAVLRMEEVKKLTSAVKYSTQDTRSSDKTQQSFYKWQDDQGQWHYSDEEPKALDVIKVEVDTAANIIPSANLTANSTAKLTESAPKHEGKASAPVSVPVIMNPMHASKYINQAKDVDRLMQERTQELNKAL